MKPDLTPRTVLVTGTTFRGWVIELESSGFPLRVIALPLEASEVTPLISIFSDSAVRIYQFEKNPAGFAFKRRRALDGCS